MAGDYGGMGLEGTEFSVWPALNKHKVHNLILDPNYQSVSDCNKRNFAGGKRDEV